MTINKVEQATILIVDDNPTNLKVLSEAIANSGWEILVATDGETAIDQSEYATPDLILLDVMMPGMDGFETCRRLKSNPATNEIPVIFMTALNDTVDKIKGLSLGAVDYITKPFQTEEVLARLKVHLQLHFLTKQLEDQNLYLEERVAERTADLQQANQQLRELEAQLRKALAEEQEFNHLKSRMIIAISHEYRTPLTSILSSSELLEAYCHRWDKSKQSQHFQRIREAVQRITDLMGNVMFLNKAEFEQLEFQPTPLDLGVFVRDLVDDMQDNYGEQHRLILNIDQDCGRPLFDSKLLLQILTHLIDNAIKYSPNGGKVLIKFACENNQVIFEVSDDGIGIPRKDQHNLFNAFHRGSNVENISGTGLGLAIVKKCVDIHGGTISLNSDVSVGTTFTVMLPRRVLDADQLLKVTGKSIPDYQSGSHFLH